MQVKSEDIQHALPHISIGNDTLLEKCAALCNRYSLPSGDLAQKLEAFLINKNCDLSFENFGQFETEVHRSIMKAPIIQRNVAVQETKKRSYTSASPDASSNGDVAKSQNFFATPGDSKASHIQSIITNGPSQSPSDISQSQLNAYHDRKGRGMSLLEYNKELGGRGDFVPSTRRPLGLRCEILTNNNEIFDSVTQRYRFMFTTLEERARALDRQLLDIQEFMCQVGDIQELQPVGIPSPDLVWVCGRVCCESAEGKINKTSVVLEGSRRDSGGRRVHLDLTEIPSFSLFPGQIILVQGINSSGRRIVAKRIVEGFPKPLAKLSLGTLKNYHLSERFQANKPLSMVIASGPFTTDMNLKYEPLEDLLRYVLQHKPDVLVLVGPFVDVSQPLLSGDSDILLDDMDDDGSFVEGKQHAASYEMVFVEKIIRDGLNVLFNSESDFGTIMTNIILVPSLLDGHHECVFPQPPFGDRDRIETKFFQEPLGVLDVPFSRESDAKKRVHLLPNPCMFRVNDVVVGVTSADPLFALSSDEVSQNIQVRVPRLAAHLIQQQSFWPLFPPSVHSLAQLDMRHAKHWRMNASPDILILPSRLKVMAEKVIGTVVVNPGQLSKGSTGGSFAEIAIHPLTEEALHTMASDETEEVFSCCAARTYVNILKI